MLADVSHELNTPLTAMRRLPRNAAGPSTSPLDRDTRERYFEHARTGNAPPRSHRAATCSISRASRTASARSTCACSRSRRVFEHVIERHRAGNEQRRDRGPRSRCDDSRRSNDGGSGSDRAGGRESRSPTRLRHTLVVATAFAPKALPPSLKLRRTAVALAEAGRRAGASSS